MFSESFKMDNGFHKIGSSGARMMTKKIALFVDPSFLENIGSQRVKIDKIEVLSTTIVCSFPYMHALRSAVALLRSGRNPSPRAKDIGAMPWGTFDATCYKLNAGISFSSIPWEHRREFSCAHIHGDHGMETTSEGKPGVRGWGV